METMKGVVRTMTTRVAINGFGRIGRLVFRQAMKAENLEVVAINDIAPLDNLVYLLRHDTVHVDPDVQVSASGDTLHWGNKDVRFLSVRNPEELPWGAMNVDLVVESTGLFTKRDDAAKHLKAGAKRVVITAPGKGADITINMGVNEEKFKPDHDFVISNASCTTNCLSPVAKVLDENFGIVTGFLTTVHAYTASQALVDAPARKMRRGRAAAANIVPTTTGAAIATTEVLPQLKGKMDGLALRVPVPDGSIIDFTVQTQKPVTVDSVNQALKDASNTKKLKGILGVSDEELVSSDIIGMTYSSMVDMESTMVIGDHTAKVLAWYDNEWGYAATVVKLLDYIAQQTGSKEKNYAQSMESAS